MKNNSQRTKALKLALSYITNNHSKEWIRKHQSIKYLIIRLGLYIHQGYEIKGAFGVVLKSLNALNRDALNAKEDFIGKAKKAIEGFLGSCGYLPEEGLYELREQICCAQVILHATEYSSKEPLKLVKEYLGNLTVAENLFDYPPY
jgi:hypothetical protein